jgi:hypothetical protein
MKRPANQELHRIGRKRLLPPGEPRRYARFQLVSAPRSCTRDEGRSLGADLQELASNHLKLLPAKMGGGKR